MILVAMSAHKMSNSEFKFDERRMGWAFNLN